MVTTFIILYLIPTITLKSSSNDLLIYFWKLNLVPGDKCTYKMQYSVDYT